jgi:polyhydroxyalkanoate synthesis repressor PhaR
MARQTVVIKKYENRRLYDTTNSRYVNLDEVAQALRDGNDVQVVDAATGEDITRLILTQIIVENAKAPDSNFPLDILRQMVVASGRVSQEGALKYMKALFDMYQSAYRAMHQTLAPFDFVQNIMGTAVRPPANEASAPPPPENPQAAPTAETSDEPEVKDLRRRLEELETLVSKLAPERKRKRKPKA